MTTIQAQASKWEAVRVSFPRKRDAGNQVRKEKGSVCRRVCKHPSCYNSPLWPSSDDGLPTLRASCLVRGIPKKCLDWVNTEWCESRRIPKKKKKRFFTVNTIVQVYPFFTRQWGFWSWMIWLMLFIMLMYSRWTILPSAHFPLSWHVFFISALFHLDWSFLFHIWVWLAGNGLCCL